MGAYADKVKPLGQTEKNRRSHSRRLVRLGYARGEAEARNEGWRGLSTETKIDNLRGRCGKSKKQIARLVAV